MSNPAQRLLEHSFLVCFKTANTLYRPLRQWIGALILVLFIAMTTAVVHVFPGSNWDMFAYTASVLEPSVDNTTDLHRQSYDFVEKNVSPGEYLILTQDRDYRIHQAENPDAFMTMLGFYRLKILYIETARLLTGFIDPVQALRLISKASILAIGGLLLVWMVRNQALSYGLPVAVLLTLSGFTEAAQLVTPDLFCTVFLLLAAMSYLEKLDWLAAVSLLCAFLVRPDHLAFIGVFFVFAAIYGPGRWWMTGCFAVCFSLYVWLTKGANHPGWWVHMWFSHIEFVPTLEGFDPPFSITAYVQMLVRATVRSLMGETWLAVLIAQVLFFAKLIRVTEMPERTRVLLYAVFVSVCAKYLVFPHYETRFYVPYLIIMGMILMISWHKQSQSDSLVGAGRT
ncbi:hypothetical protein BKI51_19930 [Alphaproteobacteria bacterium AO1-B]|nr:hypothetical protein BKI51_19930 [Alphaproteobacteria bacterium AO1-B]